MKRIMILSVLMCSLLLSACDKKEVGISENGGAINHVKAKLGEQYESER